jgi:hypothetical protein
MNFLGKILSVQTEAADYSDMEPPEVKHCVFGLGLRILSRVGKFPGKIPPEIFFFSEYFNSGIKTPK